jgi:NinB protein.
MEFKLVNESDRARLIGYLAGLDMSKPKTVTINDEDRSAEQNKKLHACLADIARQVEHAGMKWDVTVWKRLCTAAWLRETGASIQMIPAIDGQGIDVLYERTSKLSMKKCAELIEWVQAFGAEHNVKWTQKDHWEGRY